MMTGERHPKCEPCKKLVGGGRRTDPHPDLIVTNSRKAPSMLGASDEVFYVCRVCGQDWLHETGRTGMGWVE